MEPKTRKEHYLAAIAGEDVTIPEPKTRQEHYLKEIAEKGSGGGGGIFAVTVNMTIEDDVPVFSKASHTSLEIKAAVEQKLLPVVFVMAEAGSGIPTGVFTYGEFDAEANSARFANVSNNTKAVVGEDGTVYMN